MVGYGIAYERLGSWWSSWMAATLFGALPWFFVSSGWLLLLTPGLRSECWWPHLCDRALAGAGVLANALGQRAFRHRASGYAGYTHRGTRANQSETLAGAPARPSRGVGCEPPISHHSARRMAARRRGCLALCRIPLRGATHGPVDSVRSRAVVGLPPGLVAAAGSRATGRAAHREPVGPPRSPPCSRQVLRGVSLSLRTCRTI